MACVCTCVGTHDPASCMALTHDCTCKWYRETRTGYRRHTAVSGTLFCRAKTHACSCRGQLKDGPVLCKADTTRHRCCCEQHLRQCNAETHNCVCKARPSYCRVADTEHICACDNSPSVCKASGLHPCKCKSSNMRAVRHCNGLIHPCVCVNPHPSSTSIYKGPSYCKKSGDHLCACRDIHYDGCRSSVCGFKGG
jgi:hypothetical protein